MKKYDWDDIFRRMSQIAPACKSFTQACKILGVPKSSAHDEIHRRGMESSEIGPFGNTQEDTSGIKTDVHTNTATIETKSSRIKTLEQMLEECEVDLDVWEVDHYIINKWEVGAKDQLKNLRVEPLWQVKVWLKRIVPIELFPTIQPVVCNETWESKVFTRKAGLARAMVIPDPHFGYYSENEQLIPLHNEAALSLTIELIKAAMPDQIFVLGDLLDLADWSDKYFRSPEFRNHTQPAVVAAHKYGKAQRSVAPQADITWLKGNHGARIEKAIVNHLQAAYELKAADELDLPPALGLPKLMALHKLGINWIDSYPQGEIWLNRQLRIVHGETSSNVPGSSAGNVVKNSDVSVIFGHSHKLELVSYTRKTYNGLKTIQAFTPGCTCWTDGRVPAGSSNIRWQNGCGIIDYEIDGDYFNITPVLIENGHAIYNRTLYESGENSSE